MRLVKAYEEGAKPFEDLHATLLSARRRCRSFREALLERAFANPLRKKYAAGGVDYDFAALGGNLTQQPRGLRRVRPDAGRASRAICLMRYRQTRCESKTRVKH